jgi:hypothetical protein
LVDIPREQADAQGAKRQPVVREMRDALLVERAAQAGRISQQQQQK